MKSIITVLLLTCYFTLPAQHSDLEDTLSTYLAETKKVTFENKELWEVDLYAPILFVNKDTRVVYSNESDKEGLLKLSKKLFIGELPKSINIANTALDWNGKRWAMIILPLPKDKNERLNLITHELFHQAQPSLNFILYNTDNNHLDTKDGRVYLRLELDALVRAVSSNSDKNAMTYISHALGFREMRYKLFPMADSTENILELNEGMAEYTGLIMSGRSDKQISNHLNQKVEQFLTNKTFVRSFAYVTIPMYGYLLSKKNHFWNKQITTKTNLTNYFRSSFGIKKRFDIDKEVREILKSYNAEIILSEEAKREELISELLKSLVAKFVTNSHFELIAERMNVSFDPRNIISLSELGSVYPTIRVTDSWGILTVQNGALMSSGWDKITVSAPTEINSNCIRGDGWTLELNSDVYTIRQDIYTKNYYLVKK